jgi:hypothetical protein
VGFKQRERKRKQKAAAKIAQARSRQSGTSTSNWWLTPLTSTASCARCGTVVRADSDGVYRHVPREVRCVPCAEKLKDSKGYRPSLRWGKNRSAGGGQSYDR